MILGRIRSALADVTQPDPALDVPIEWEYGRPSGTADVLGTFVEMVVDYQAVVKRVPASEVAATIATLLTEYDVASVVVPAGLDPAWRSAITAAGVELRADDPPLSHQQLNRIGGVVTASAVGIAETGTIVLDHREDQGRRALSLVPDLHVCVVRADQVVSDVPEAVGRLAGSVTEGHPLTWISGGSATSDIELSRVEGVHGPRTLLVVLAE
ncbi:MAG: lactate utilization protein C [Propionicimonas sp.]|uniref:LutC/YkgG family protein n=1 Tax=Propionicimonas sp. TaxID=1955623 RepID=UPI002B1FB2E8|nr:lactate utilization protein C [Propionicimonas sp.]MEA4945321.1 lactate utilization protein C [Propionicimonas sp.]MEA5053151.1 lactate utilization protein C [Propionicimonas sp.]